MLIRMSKLGHWAEVLEPAEPEAWAVARIASSLCQPNGASCWEVNSEHEVLEVALALADCRTSLENFDYVAFDRSDAELVGGVFRQTKGGTRNDALNSIDTHFDLHFETEDQALNFVMLLIAKFKQKAWAGPYRIRKRDLLDAAQSANWLPQDSCLLGPKKSATGTG